MLKITIESKENTERSFNIAMHMLGNTSGYEVKANIIALLRMCSDNTDENTVIEALEQYLEERMQNE